MIKPGFFQNEDLAELSAAHRLLFIGLWTLADREGRLEDRPRRIQASIFPYEPLPVHEMLDELAASGFIRRYAVNEKLCIEVVNFRKHQHVHHKETPSELPSYEEAREIPGSTPGKYGELPGKPQTDPVTSTSTSTSTFTSTSEKKQRTRLRAAPNGALVLPDWIPKANWEAFLEMRKKLRAPMTLRAQELAVGTLDKLRGLGFDPAAVLDQSVERSWRGLFPINAEGGGYAKRSGAPSEGAVDRWAVERRRMEEALRDEPRDPE